MEERALETLEGTFLEEVYRKSGDWAIGFIKDVDGNTVKIMGVYDKPGKQERVTIEGSWETDRKNGKPFFRVSTMEIHMPTTEDGIVGCLAKESMGIGEELAKAIVAKFGVDTVRILDNDSDRLLDVKGIGKKRLQSIKSAWENIKTNNTQLLFLYKLKIPHRFLATILQKYGKATEELITLNPYILTRFSGIGFITADNIAARLGIYGADPRRVQAGCLYCLREITEKEGNTAIVLSYAVEKAIDILGCSDEEVVELGYVPLANSTDRKVFYYDLGETSCLLISEYDKYERAVANKLGILADAEPRVFHSSLEWSVRTVGAMELSEEQIAAVLSSLRSSVSVITGGPGVGKTTVIRAILQGLKARGCGQEDIAMAAPTGRAAKKMEEMTDAEARTIHRLLGYGAKGFAYMDGRLLPHSVVIIDEVSMVDIALMNHLVRSLSNTTQLILVGDVDQLPSVGPGNVLKDVIDSGIVQVSRLTKIYRQAARSMIISNAHRVNQGVPALFDPDEGQNCDMTLDEEEDPEAIPPKVYAKIEELRAKGYSTTDIQVMSPMNNGPIGVEALNKYLRSKLNPYGRVVCDFHDFSIRVGDRVIHTRNNYALGVFNGDTGVVVEPPSNSDLLESRFYKNLDHAILWVEYPDKEDPIPYSSAYITQLRLAYAITIHKSQGSQYPAVIIVMHEAHYIMLARNLLYTAITRAERLAHVVGTRKAVFIAAKNNKVSKRSTLLKERLLGTLEVE